MEGPKPEDLELLLQLGEEIRAIEREWVSAQFPQFVPCFEVEGKMLVAVRRVASDKKSPRFIIPVFTSLEAKDRSSLWCGEGCPDLSSAYFIKVKGIKEAEAFWSGVIKATVRKQSLTEKDVHSVFLIFNHRNEQKLPDPQCLFCYIVTLRKEVKALMAHEKETNTESLIENVQVLGEAPAGETEGEDPPIDLD